MKGFELSAQGDGLRRRGRLAREGSGNHARAREDFEAGMDDDLNTSKALAAVFEFRRDVNTAMDAGEFGADDRAAALEVACADRFGAWGAGRRAGTDARSGD